MNWKILREPIHVGELIFSTLLYFLGLSVAVYLGTSIDWAEAAFGLVALLSLHLAMQYLYTYFAIEEALLTRLEEFFKLYQAKRASDQIIIDRPRFLFALLSLPFFLIFTLAILILAQQGAFTVGFALILFLMLLLWGLMVVPPVQLLSTASRDVFTGLLWVIFYPVFAIILQRGTSNNVLFLFTLPLFLIYLSNRIALQMEHYDSDSHRQSQTLLVQIGWETGMRLHNIILLAAFVILLLTPIIFSLAWSLVWPLLLALPFALAQFLQMIRIQNGSPPNWRLLRFAAQATLY